MAASRQLSAAAARMAVERSFFIVGLPC
jgi:hypothetical protein